MPLFFLLVQEQPVLPEQSEDTSVDSLEASAAVDTADSADMPVQQAAASVAQGIPPCTNPHCCTTCHSTLNITHECDSSSFFYYCHNYLIVC